MAADSKEQRSVSRPSNRAAFTASFPATSSSHVPSSLPRPTAQALRSQHDSLNGAASRVARSSLTNGAIQRARQLAGDETPLAVSQARAARQAAAGTSSKADSSLIGDNSGDATAQLVPGPRDPALDPVRAIIDVENPQMPSLSQPTMASPSAPQSSQRDDIQSAPVSSNIAANTSISSQGSVFGTSNRRNGQDQPIGASSNAVAGTAYDFSKYLDSEMDPFNRASRGNVRRESRPLPVSQSLQDEDDAELSGDTTARGGAPASSTTNRNAVPVESTPLVSRVKAIAASTPRMSPHASPSVSSHKLSHLSSLSNGHAVAAPLATPGNASTASIASHNRFDPSARTDRIQNMEIGELRKKHATLVRELAMAQDALTSAKEESEGWASECTGLQEQLTSLKSTHQAAIAREARVRAELQVRLHQYKIEADDRAWKLLAQRRQANLIDVALQHAKNEATYHEGRYHATESELEGQKDELRIRLMLERKRADLLAMHVKAAMRDGSRLKKKLSAKTSALAELQNENERLAEQLEDARRSVRKPAGGDEDAAALRQQLEEAQAEIETLNERDAMMAETRKTWKAERKQLLARVEELSAKSTSAPVPSIPKALKPAEAPRPVKTSKLLAASQAMLPSSPVYTRKKQPMQGASELGPPSEDDEEDRRAAGKVKTAKTAAPLVPFAKIAARNSAKAALSEKSAKSVKNATASKSKPSKNWRDEVAITDSSEEDSDDDRKKHRRVRGAAHDSDSEQESDNDARPKSKSTNKKSSAKRTNTNGSSAARTKSSTAARKTKPTMPIEYDDQTADPSATPIIRSNKRNMPTSDDDQPAADSSVLAAKFGRNRTNLILPAPKDKIAKGGKVATIAPVQDGQVKKKKRKLLGGGIGAMQWGGAAGGDAASDAAGLAPNFDIPLELSPIKGGGGGRGGAGAAFLAGFGLPSRNPFA